MIVMLGFHKISDMLYNQGLRHVGQYANVKPTPAKRGLRNQSTIVGKEDEESVSGSSESANRQTHSSAGRPLTPVFLKDTKTTKGKMALACKIQSLSFELESFAPSCVNQNYFIVFLSQARVVIVPCTFIS